MRDYLNQVKYLHHLLQVTIIALGQYFINGPQQTNYHHLHPDLPNLEHFHSLLFFILFQFAY